MIGNNTGIDSRYFKKIGIQQSARKFHNITLSIMLVVEILSNVVLGAHIGVGEVSLQIWWI